MSGSVDVVGFAGGEPSIHPEYLNEVFSKCRAKGMETYLETNGYMTASTAETLAKYTNYVAFGLKASVDPTYYSQKLGVMDTQPIREAVKTFVNKGCNVALTNLTDPSLWDDRDAFNELVKWIHNDLGDETRLVLGSLERGELPPPWTEERIHVTPRGPRVDHLQMYREIAKKTGLRQVFCVFQSPRVGRDLPRLQLATSQGSK
jgi:pyruvate-formate lyase-activating enzyme